MIFYAAPMEGLTGYVYRNAHHAFFDNVEKYFAPFILANQSDSFKARELNDLLPDNNKGLVLIPQLLTNNARDFLHTAGKLKALGYQEINFNLGCPSGTVVSKYRGSGFLAKKQELDAFLDEVFSAAEVKISVKTRLGKDRPEEFYELMDIFNKYPLEELIIHPRIQTDYYRNKPNLKIFEEALLSSKNPVCYNGDLFTADDFAVFTAAFPLVNTVMLGRGLIANPGLTGVLLYKTALEKTTLKAFHDTILRDYKKLLSGDRNVLFKMKEIWVYMISLFPDSASYAKRIKKAERLSEYEAAVSSLFSDRALLF